MTALCLRGGAAWGLIASDNR